MKLVVLSDNQAMNDLLESEHGLCVYLETEQYKCLLDTGASDIFIRNAEKLAIDLSDVDYVFISHGHADHIGGLLAFLQINRKAKVVLSKNANNQSFFSKRNGLHRINTDLNLSFFADRLIYVTMEMFFKNEICVFPVEMNKYPLPKANAILYKSAGNGLESEDFNHELVITFGLDNLVVYSGCAHKGLLNILGSVSLFSSKQISCVIGGFHLLDSKNSLQFETPEEIDFIAQELIKKYPQTTFITGHCTGKNVYELMKHQLGCHLKSFYAGYSLIV